ncbi:TM2 domain-containing protein [Giardia duodenalis]|uniref:TM2 domain-containing protein n=2 Tax=Giardia intestinalis TaxID=5741 RepID=A8BRA2_GIAIC|nr:TM2 domain-containing protein [Giardia intestinalis]ESU37485.1 Putative TM2 domain protein [Giardia intestinalis]KAE8304408.1 TM2 domain-containing protein [Giardia intestinalis]|eukprot:XP_001705349.1 Hypothetical protein GL50803_20593 [Giardia lamblia ATCC 50803]
MALIKLRSMVTTYLLWLFLGIFGGHRFYLYQYDMGLLYLFTAGIFLMGWITDAFIIPFMVWETNTIIRAINRQQLQFENEYGENTIVHPTRPRYPLVTQVKATEYDGPKVF